MPPQADERRQQQYPYSFRHPLPQTAAVGQKEVSECAHDSTYAGTERVGLPTGSSCPGGVTSSHEAPRRSTNSLRASKWLKQQQTEQAQRHSPSGDDQRQMQPDVMTQVGWLLNRIQRYPLLCTLVTYTAVLLLNYLTSGDGALEWLLFSVFTFGVFVQTYAVGPDASFTMALVVACADVAVYTLVPFEYTSLAASWVFYYSVGETLRSLDGGGLWLAVAMTFARLFIPWYGVGWDTGEPGFAPRIIEFAAAHCTALGLCYIGYIVATCPLGALTMLAYVFGGLTIPPTPVISLKHVSDTSVRVSWSYRNGSFRMSEVQSHVVEFEGKKVHESSAATRCVAVERLFPDEMYRIRVWAIGKRVGKTPSSYLVVRTASLKEANGKTDDAEKASAEAKPDVNGTRQNSQDVPLTPVARKEEMEQLQEEVNQTRRQCEEIEKAIAEAKKAAYKEEAQLQAELAKLREARRAEDVPRAQVRLQFRALEEAKREVKQTKQRLARELRSRMATIGENEKAIVRFEREAARLREDMRRLHAQAEAEDKESAGRRGELERRVREAREVSEGAWSEVAESERRLEDLRALLAQRSRSLANVNSQLAAVDRAREEWEARRLELEKEQREVFAHYEHLVKENRDLQDELREVNRAKMILLEELARARRERKPSAFSSSALTPSDAGLAPGVFPAASRNVYDVIARPRRSAVSPPASPPSLPNGLHLVNPSGGIHLDDSCDSGPRGIGSGVALSVGGGISGNSGGGGEWRYHLHHHHHHHYHHHSNDFGYDSNRAPASAALAESYTPSSLPFPYILFR